MPVFLPHHLTHWYSPAQPLLDLPENLKPWLLASGSLTRQLTLLAHGQFHVDPLRQGFERLYLHENQLLNIPFEQQAWVREVYLYGCEQEPWVRARSIFPLKSLKGQGLRLRYLKNKSLGSLLFYRSQPQCVRQIAKLPEGWSRRSLYLWHNQPLIVQETFLSAFENFLAAQKNH
ncbi:chorismate--pyruvate lyase family protein [Alkanindiges sp. WGS2144]|uniref:chorismate--pyruvate lyase family protein n=1 Tax=Alkanindiges sp. WGS2144 TaxID=3366808 RepID=UPI003750E90B